MTVEDKPTGGPLRSIAIHTPLADQELLHHRSMALTQALPDVLSTTATNDSGTSAAILNLVTNVAENTAQTREFCKTLEVRATKISSDRFKNILPILMNALLVNDKEELPDLWHFLPNTEKKQDFIVLQDTLETFAASKDAFLDKAPVISNKLKDDLLKG
jgi:hypothetical protein